MPTESPVVFGAAEHDALTKYIPKIVESMRAYGLINPKTEIILDSTLLSQRKIRFPCFSDRKIRNTLSVPMEES